MIKKKEKEFIIINENRKNTELIRNDISNILKQKIRMFKEDLNDAIN